jgi:hypothetical protein
MNLPPYEGVNSSVVPYRALEAGPAATRSGGAQPTPCIGIQRQSNRAPDRQGTPPSVCPGCLCSRTTWADARGPMARCGPELWAKEFPQPRECSRALADPTLDQRADSRFRAPYGGTSPARHRGTPPTHVAKRRGDGAPRDSRNDAGLHPDRPCDPTGTKRARGRDQ